ncbi:MAG TPA: chromosome segregation protein SMC [Myxococcota bacterium]|nr:chromosome segregation protein SMC [Myxococcota bacterium]
MKIRRLDIVGFKSFADASCLRFDDGTTGIVGPNGCGKSNVVDAIRWVMGEQSARRLRGKNMEDVVFAGSETKPPMGMAEVRLTFENDGRNIPPEYAAYSEITVGRCLFRSGESEYSINRTPCRLLDVQELFMGTGVGTRAYSIIGQGTIGLLISQKPIERRALIEEAAGVSKYNSRKRVAERKMEQTRQNLLRVNDVIAEIKRNINSLKRQAGKAARYNKIRSQLREIDLHQAAYTCLELTANRSHLEAKQVRLTDNSSQAGAELSRLEASVEQKRTRLLDDERRISQKSEELLSIDNQIKLNEKNIEFLTREVESLNEHGQRSAREIEDLRSEAAKLAGVMEKARRELVDLRDTSQAAQARLREKENAHHAQQTKVDELLSLIDSDLRIQRDLSEQAGELRSRVSGLDQRLVDLEGRLGQVQAEHAALSKNYSELSENSHTQTEKLNHSRQLQLDLAQRRESSENSLAELQAQAKENEAKLMALRDEINTRRSRLESLSEIEHNYEGCLSGVQWVMKNAQAKRDESQVLGLVADILQAPPRYETAVQAVLGDRLQSVVVKSQGAGLQAVDYLKSESEGRSSFIPLSLRDSAQADLSTVKGPGVIGPMRELVNYQEQYDPVVRYLIGDVMIIEDLPRAMEIWTNNGHKATLVTLDGDVLEPQGVLTGGSLEGSGTRLLHNKREIRELADKLKDLEAEYRMVQDRHGKLKAQLAVMDTMLESLRQNSHEEEIQIVDQQKDLSHMHQQVESIAGRLSKLDGDRQDLQERIDVNKRERESCRLEIEENSAGLAAREDAIRASREKASAQKHSLAVLGQEVIDLKVQAAATVGRSEAAQRNLDHVAHSLTEIGQRIERRKNDITSGNLQSTQGQQQIRINREDISDSLTHHEALHSEIGASRDAYEVLLAEVRGEEASFKEQRRDHESLTQELTEAVTRLREIEIELSHLSSDVQRAHKTDLAACLSVYHLLPPPSAEQLERAEKLRNTLERMGDVNPHAVEYYEENVQRFEFLSTQSQDLDDSLQKLHRVIVKINRTSRKRFREAFEAINAKFIEIYPQLFNGGKGRLKLEETQDILEAGVDIIVQPPGKKLQNMELLSGGEKALTSVALLFSIFLVKPTPFCLLDEVDAPLDDSNLDRVNVMVREMAKSSQFILITHSKRTMEIVDRLYGITMEEPGISKVVSVKLKEDDELLKRVG